MRYVYLSMRIHVHTACAHSALITLSLRVMWGHCLLKQTCTLSTLSGSGHLDDYYHSIDTHPRDTILGQPHHGEAAHSDVGMLSPMMWDRGGITLGVYRWYPP